MTAKTGHHKMTFYSANLALGSGADKYADYFETCRRKRNVIDYTRSHVATDTALNRSSRKRRSSVNLSNPGSTRSSRL